MADPRNPSDDSPPPLPDIVTPGDDGYDQFSDDTPYETRDFPQDD
jgi:hypothetical protein